MTSASASYSEVPAMLLMGYKNILQHIFGLFPSYSFFYTHFFQACPTDHLTQKPRNEQLEYTDDSHGNAKIKAGLLAIPYV